jgi:hypothetical protein
MASPVLGFLPVRPLRSEIEKVPNPETFILSPFFKAATISSRNPLTISSAFCRGISARLANESIKSALVITLPFKQICLIRRCAFITVGQPSVKSHGWPKYRNNYLLRKNLSGSVIFDLFSERSWPLFRFHRYRRALEKIFWIVND